MIFYTELVHITTTKSKFLHLGLKCIDLMIHILLRSWHYHLFWNILHSDSSHGNKTLLLHPYKQHAFVTYNFFNENGSSIAIFPPTNISVSMSHVFFLYIRAFVALLRWHRGFPLIYLITWVNYSFIIILALKDRQHSSSSVISFLNNAIINLYLIEHIFWILI